MLKVLLVKTSSLGDVVHNLPVVADIRARFPDACIDWLVEEAYAPLVRLQPANPKSSLFLGQVYAQIGRVDEAIRLLMEGEQVAQRAGNATTAQYCREIRESLQSQPRNAGPP